MRSIKLLASEYRDIKRRHQTFRVSYFDLRIEGKTHENAISLLKGRKLGKVMI